WGEGGEGGEGGEETAVGPAAYLLKGTEKAMAESFGSTCHGAGRVMGRRAARKVISGHELKSWRYAMRPGYRWK
ncbi:MAG: RtcB family protein, partial [Thermoleophilia bacterium]